MWGFVILVVAVVVGAGAVALLRRHRTPVTLAAFLRGTALVFIAACTAVITLFLAGDTIADPGGWQTAALIALWLVPLAVLAVLAWWQPGWATAVLAILLAGAVALAVWYAADPAAWIGYENQHGPVRAVVSFVLLLPAGLLGWRRPLTGAVLLLVLGLAPAGIVAVSAHLAASFAAISGPAAIGGLLYLFAALTARHHGHPAHPEPTRAAHPRPYRPAGRTGLLPAAPPAAKGLGTQRRRPGMRRRLS